MRSISQSFADHLQAREYTPAIFLLRKNGIIATQAHIWLAGHDWKGEAGEQELLGWVDQFPIPAEDLVDAYLRRLATPPGLDDQDPILEWIDKKVDYSLLEKRAVLHHAAYHGRHYLLSHIAQKLEQAGHPVNWNDDRPDLGTPLFIALRENNEETTLELVRSGADGDLPIKHGVRPTLIGQAVYKAAAITSTHKDSEIEDLYKRIKRRVHLEKVAEKAGKFVERSMKKVGIKM